MRVVNILATVTIQRWRLFCSELLIVWLQFEGGDLFEEYSIYPIILIVTSLLLPLL